jgi:hypothetical protein
MYIHVSNSFYEAYAYTRIHTAHTCINIYAHVQVCVPGNLQRDRHRFVGYQVCACIQANIHTSEMSSVDARILPSHPCIYVCMHKYMHLGAHTCKMFTVKHLGHEFHANGCCVCTIKALCVQACKVLDLFMCWYV